MYNGSAKHLSNLAKAREVARTAVESCIYCGKPIRVAGLVSHERSCAARRYCPVCDKQVKGNDRQTCSQGCANTLFRSGTNHGNWKNDSYRSTCFAHHEKACVVCGEQRIVEVHHFDGNRGNNLPENLIPLCPTHHAYWHSRHRRLVEPAVVAYLAGWRAG